jgi:ABC-type sugar transport system substrate-binding protein
MRKMGAAVGVALLLLGAVACGSSDNDSAGGKVSSGAKSGDAIVAQAKAEVAKYRDKPKFVAPGDPISAEKVADKLLYVIPNNLVADELAGTARGIQAAAKVAGIKVTVFNANGAVAQMQQGFQNAIAANASAIVILGIPPEFVTNEAAEAKGKGIPVIATLDAQPDASKPGQGAGENFFGYAGLDYHLLGRVMADLAIIKGDGKVNAGLLSFNNAIARANIDGVKSVLDECSDCKVLKEQDIEPLKWPTDVAQATSSMIRSNPDMNFILPAVDTMGIFASAGVRQAGAVGRTFVISSDGSGPGALGLVKEGDVFIADPGSATGWLGWAIVDQSMRAMLGEKPADGVVPFRVIESDTLADIDPKDEDSIYGSDYRDGFKQLWGLS